MLNYGTAIPIILFNAIFFYFTALDMCVSTSSPINVSAGSYVYLDTTGSPTFSTVKCSCEIEISVSITVDVKYRTENSSSCGLRFQLRDSEWGCYHRGASHVDPVQVQGFTNLTFFRSDPAVRHVYGCMGLSIRKYFEVL